MSKHILIVDDDEDDRDLFCSAVGLLDSTFTCSQSASCEDALCLLRTSISKAPDYIFLDLNMPRLNGKQCLMELKKDPLLAGIPVIIYTTSKLKEDMDETRKLGAVYFITKPTSLDDLCKEILFVLSRKWEKVLY